jgi:carnitine 3-dehydrogenase
VAEGVASVVGINVAISAGPELCGASMGPYLTFHLAGRASGIDHFIDQFAAPMGAGGPALRGLLVKGIADEAADRGIAAFEARRDLFSVDLLALKARRE